MLTESEAAAIAAELRAKNKGPFAFLADGAQVYYSTGTQPILSLIQGIYDHRSDHARRILRSRIFSTEPMTESERGMLKVAAKRATAPFAPSSSPSAQNLEFRYIEPLPASPLIPFDELSLPAQELLKSGKIMDAAFQMAEEIPREPELYRSDRRVAAILVAEDGTFLTAARNSNAKNRTRHAEMNLVQGLLRERGIRIPAGACIYVTLKCCKMCAAMILENAEDPHQLQVIYGEDDPGPNARNTVFARLGVSVESQAPAPWRRN